MEPEGAPKHDDRAAPDDLDDLALRLSALRRASASLDMALEVWHQLEAAHTHEDAETTDDDREGE